MDKTRKNTITREKFLIFLACFLISTDLPAWDYISPDSLNTWINRSAIPFLVDVREHGEYVARHIPQAALYPYNSGVIGQRYVYLPQDRPLVLICAAGGRAAAAGDLLESQSEIEFSGINVLQGGMGAWNHDVLIDDQRSYSQQQALCEMFTSPLCSDCYTANLYLDNEILPYIFGSNAVSFPRYRLFFPDPMPDVEDRFDFYQANVVPIVVINGTEIINPMDLTPEKIFYSSGQETQLMVDIYGSLQGEDDTLDLRLEIKAGPTVDNSVQYNLFILVSQDNITPNFWDPPQVPPNGETLFNGFVRNFVESDTGSTFTIQPGETRFVDRSVLLDSTYSTARCSVVTFIQDLETHKVYQVNSLRINELSPFNSGPSVALTMALDPFVVSEGDSLAVCLDIRDPDQQDKVTLSLEALFSDDGTTYLPYSSEEFWLGDSTLFIKPVQSPVGMYRLNIVGTDRWGSSDTVSLNVSDTDTVGATAKCCDFSGNSLVDAADIISFLMMLRLTPLNPRLDWNNDGQMDIADAVALLLDIRGGRCPVPAGSGGLLASVRGDLNYKPIAPGSLDNEDINWLIEAIISMDINHLEQEELLKEIYELGGRAELPQAFSLAQNTPNPFNPSTSINFNVPQGGPDVSLKVYDLRGRLVRVLVDGERSSGRHTVFFDGRDRFGRSLPSGIYIYRLSSGEFSATRKMILLK